MSRKFTNVYTTDVCLVVSTFLFYILSIYYYSLKLGICCLGDIQIQMFTEKGLRQQFLVVLHVRFTCLYAFYTIYLKLMPMNINETTVKVMKL